MAKGLIIRMVRGQLKVFKQGKPKLRKTKRALNNLKLGSTYKERMALLKDKKIGKDVYGNRVEKNNLRYKFRKMGEQDEIVKTRILEAFNKKGKKVGETRFSFSDEMQNIHVSHTEVFTQYQKRGIGTDMFDALMKYGQRRDLKHVDGHVINKVQAKIRSKHKTIQRAEHSDSPEDLRTFIPSKKKGKK